jgi:hypothetical protein
MRTYTQLVEGTLVTYRQTRMVESGESESGGRGGGGVKERGRLREWHKLLELPEEP